MAGYVSIRLILRQDRDQAVGVYGPGVSGRRAPGREDDAAPAAVDGQDAEPVVIDVLWLLEVQAGLRVLGEGGDRLVDGTLDVLIELRVVSQKVL